MLTLKVQVWLWRVAIAARQKTTGKKHHKLKFSPKTSKKKNNNTQAQTPISTWFALHFRLGSVWLSSRRSRAPSKTFATEVK